MKTVRSVVACLCIGVLSAASALAVGFDPRGAQEAAGLSREFDDATRLQQMQQAPQLPAPPVVNVTKPSPPPEQQVDADSSPLLQASQKMSAEQARQALQQAERQIQRERSGGFWQTTWRFLLWSSVGAALSWAVWSWMVRRASDSLRLG
ncbi:MAG: hypothetical protein KatS3mg022_1879 [Armatimonadota bacterium]|nr:MAG: hypothetical protein KatS3mg022_1879 [Armatimonadota bacterium]